MKRLLVAVIALVCAFAVPAHARHHHPKHHHHYKHARHHLVHHAKHHHARLARHRYSRRTHVARGVVPGGFFSGFTGGLVERARADIGKTASQLGLRRSLWCSAYMNLITGGGTHSDLAVSWLSKRHTTPHVGAIAVMGRKRGGHVGVVSGFDARGNPIIISGNHGHRVGEGVYPRGRIIAYVQP